MNNDSNVCVGTPVCGIMPGGTGGVPARGEASARGVNVPVGGTTGVGGTPSVGSTWTTWVGVLVASS